MMRAIKIQFSHTYQKIRRPQKSLVLNLLKKINDTEYRLFGISATINENKINLNDFMVKVENSNEGSEIFTIYTNKKEEFCSYKFNNLEIFDIKLSKKVNNKYLEFENNNLKALIMLLIYSEIKSQEFLKFSQNKIDETINEINAFESLTQRGGGCNRTITLIRYTESSAIYHVQQATQTFLEDHSDCSTLYGVDSGCLWGGYGCVATQQIHCSGSTCNEPSLQFL